MLGRSDQPVLWAQVYSASTAAAGPITAGLVVVALNPTEQGLYYTFGSVLSVLPLLDFGSSATLAQLVARTQGAFARSPSEVDAAHESRILSAAKTWNWLGVLLFVAVGGFGGAWILTRSAGDSRDTILLSWCVYVVAASYQATLQPKFALLQGRQLLAEFWHFRVVYHWVYSGVLWGVLIASGGVWSLPAAAGAGVLVSQYFLAEHESGWQSPKHRSSLLARFRFLIEVMWPLQWRLGASWFAATFTLSGLAAITMLYLGPVAAGQVGLTVAVVLVLIAFGLNWVAPNEPRLARLAAEGNHSELRSLFKKAFWRATSLCAMMVVGLGAGFCILNFTLPGLAARFLPLRFVVMLLSGAFAVVLIRNMGSYCRAYCVDPSAIPLAAGATLSLAASVLFGRLGLMGLLVGYPVSMMAVSLPWAYARYRGEWIRRPSRCDAALE